MPLLERVSWLMVSVSLTKIILRILLHVTWQLKENNKTGWLNLHRRKAKRKNWVFIFLYNTFTVSCGVVLGITTFAFLCQKALWFFKTRLCYINHVYWSVGTGLDTIAILECVYTVQCTLRHLKIPLSLWRYQFTKRLEYLALSQSASKFCTRHKLCEEKSAVRWRDGKVFIQFVLNAQFLSS